MSLKLKNLGKSYFYAAPQLFTDSERPGFVGTSWTLGQGKSTRAEARKNGLEEYGSDDFLIAEFSTKCDAVWVDGKRHTEKSKDFGDDVREINEELGTI